MSTVQRVAQIFGWVFVVVAIWGFVVSGMSMEADPEVAPKIMGLFAMNVLHNIVHLLFGIWGIMAARAPASARTYALAAGTIYLVLTILGFLVPTTFGLIPIGGHNIWLHALIAVVLLGAGVSATAATSAGGMGDAAPAPPAPPAGPGPMSTGAPGATASPSPTTPDRPAAPPPPTPDRPAAPPPPPPPTPDRPATPPPPPPPPGGSTGGGSTGGSSGGSVGGEGDRPA